MKEKKEHRTERRTQVKELSRGEKQLSKDEQKKVKGGDWLMTPAGSVKPDSH